MLPDTAKMSEKLRTCLQENDDTPRDMTSLFDNTLFKLDTTTVPKVIRLVLSMWNAEVSSSTFIIFAVISRDLDELEA